jgi:amino acid adenylation domain-containing protein
MTALAQIRNLSPAQRDALVARLRSRQQQNASAGQGIPQIEPDPARRRDAFPLTDIQQAYWVGRQAGFEMGNIAAHGYLEIEARDIDLPRLEAAFNQVIARHDMLRAVIQPDGRQRILADVPDYRFATTNLRQIDEAERTAQLAALRELLSHQVLPTELWPLFDIRVSLLPDNGIRLHLSLDVLIFDAHSFDNVISPEWQNFYAAPERPLPPLEFSFADYVAGLHQLETSDSFQKSLAYWRQRLDSLPPGPEFPLAKNPESVKKPHFAHRSLRLPRLQWDALRRTGSAHRITPAALLLSAYALTVGRWSQSPHFTLNLTLFNRQPFHPEVNHLVGDFTSVTLLEIDLRSFKSFGEMAHAIQSQLWEDMDHRAVSGVRVLREITEHRRGTQAMTVPVVFTGALSNDAAGEAPAAMSWLGEPGYVVTQTPQVWLDCQAVEDDGDLILDWDSVDELFEPGFIDAMFAGFGKLIGLLTNDSDSWARPRLNLLPDSQLAMMSAVNQTTAPIPAGLLHAPLLARCRTTPDRLAVADGRRELNFGQLYRESNALAHAILAAGLPRSSLIGVMLPKSASQVVAVLGILESGNAYLPIEPSLPLDRIVEILRLSGAAAVVTDAATLVERPLPETAHRFSLDAIETPAPRPLPTLAGPRDLAYVIYTSGSTGTPKGVAIDHRGALNTCIDCNQRFAIDENDRVLGLSALNFDLSVWDIFGVIGAGGALILPDYERAREPAHWAECMATHGVTVWNTVPALLDLYVSYRREVARDRDTTLRLAMMSGDWIPLTLPGQIRATCPQAEIFSLGGATEASIWSILHPIGEVNPAWHSIPYGRPMLNQTFHVRDDRLDHCPVGVPGELCIGGIGVAMGYWQDEARTAAQFVFCPHTGERLYRTGDLGRWLPDGNLEILGRLDFQVKINGYRVELGEIEAAMAACKGVLTGVAQVVGGAGQAKQLIGYYVRDNSDADAENRKLQARLNRDGIRRLAAPLLQLPGAEVSNPARRSVRHFLSDEVSQQALAAMLAPLRLADVNGIARYRYASGGGFYPVQLYVQVAPGRVKGLAGGLYYFHPGENSLQLVDAARTLSPEWFPRVNRPVIDAAAFCLFLVGSRQAIEPHYGAAAAPVLCMLEAGAMTQLLEDSAAAVGLGTVQLGGFRADKAGDFFGLGDDALYLHMLVGGMPGEEPAAAPGSSVITDNVFEEGLRAHLASRLADYMVPRQFVRIEHLPLSANGKVDRKALPEPRARRAMRTVAAGQLEQDPLAQEIRSLWQEVLKLDRIALDDNFFDLGGTSVDMIRIHTRLQPRLAQPVTLVDMFFSHPTIGDFVRAQNTAQPVPPAAEQAEPAPELPRNRRARNRNSTSTASH